MSRFDTDTMHTEDTLDVRDIIERFEELRDELEAAHDDREVTLSFEYALQDAANFPEHADEYAEYRKLLAVLEDLKGNGGDEQWEGDWYPVGLIHERYFTDAMRELVQDIGDLPRDIPAYLEIDWDKTAENLRVDYSSVEIGDATFWYR